MAYKLDGSLARHLLHLAIEQLRTESERLLQARHIEVGIGYVSLHRVRNLSQQAGVGTVGIRLSVCSRRAVVVSAECRGCQRRSERYSHYGVAVGTMYAGYSPLLFGKFMNERQGVCVGRLVVVSHRVVAVEDKRQVGLGYRLAWYQHVEPHPIVVGRNGYVHGSIGIASSDGEVDKFSQYGLQAHHVDAHVCRGRIRTIVYVHRLAVAQACIVGSPSAKVHYIKRRLGCRVVVGSGLHHVESLVYKHVHVDHVVAHLLQPAHAGGVLFGMKHVEHRAEQRAERLLELSRQIVEELRAGCRLLHDALLGGALFVQTAAHHVEVHYPHEQCCNHKQINNLSPQRPVPRRKDSDSVAEHFAVGVAKGVNLAHLKRIAARRQSVVAYLMALAVKVLPRAVDAFQTIGVHAGLLFREGEVGQLERDVVLRGSERYCRQIGGAALFGHKRLAIDHQARHEYVSALLL